MPAREVNSAGELTSSGQRELEPGGSTLHYFRIGGGGAFGPCANAIAITRPLVRDAEAAHCVGGGAVVQTVVPSPRRLIDEAVHEIVFREDEIDVGSSDRDTLRRHTPGDHGPCAARERDRNLLLARLHRDGLFLEALRLD